MGKIILGSSSPRRADILKKLNVKFEIIPSDYVEPHDRTDFSYDYVENLALNKAIDVAQKHSNATIIGADTIVVINNKILGKPKDKKEAYNMLKLLSGKTHFVVTAVAVVDSSDKHYQVKSETTYVTFENLTDEKILFYIDKYKPFDKAGAYGIQELPLGYVKEVKGEIDNVVGLPSKLLLEMLKLGKK